MATCMDKNCTLLTDAKTKTFLELSSLWMLLNSQQSVSTVQWCESVLNFASQKKCPTPCNFKEHLKQFTAIVSHGSVLTGFQSNDITLLKLFFCGAFLDQCVLLLAIHGHTQRMPWRAKKNIITCVSADLPSLSNCPIEDHVCWEFAANGISSSIATDSLTHHQALQLTVGCQSVKAAETGGWVCLLHLNDSHSFGRGFLHHHGAAGEQCEALNIGFSLFAWNSDSDLKTDNGANRMDVFVSSLRVSMDLTLIQLHLDPHTRVTCFSKWHSGYMNGSRDTLSVQLEWKRRHGLT